MPSWQEVATTILPVAMSIIVISLSYRYLPIFPQERELNPLEPPALPAQAPELEAGTDEAAQTPAERPEPELSPAES